MWLALLLLVCKRSEGITLDEEDGFGMEEESGATPRLIPGQWSQCSTSCGPGVQSRGVDCRGMHPLTGHRRLPMIECSDLPSPPLFRPCILQQCAQQEEPSELKEQFHWKHSEWSPCSATCLGGKQRALLQCVQVSTGRSVAWSNCDARRRPPENTRMCNQRPCPPEWKPSPWSECPKECGAERTRTVRCVRPATQAGGATTQMIVKDEECTGEKPEAIQSCGENDCYGWKVSDWSACSVSCGRGEESRSVQCSLPTSCPSPAPLSIRPCKKDVCPKEKETSADKLTLDLGGVATVYQGTSIKVKCPRKKSDKKKVYWLKDGEKIVNTPHIKVSSNGNLRISNARIEDTGVYECLTEAGSKGNVSIRFKLREKDIPLHGGNTVKKEKARYKGGEWGECHQSSCALRGIQERNIQCFLIEGRIHRKVNNAICETLNVARPPISRPCSRTDCAHWNVSDWTACASSPCIHKWTSEQTRLIRCLSDGKKVEEDACDASTRPTTTTQCLNHGCLAEWKASLWSSCSSSCGTGGVQLRLLHCVWANTGKHAGRACDGLPQPRTTRACALTAPLPSCPPRMKEDVEREDCIDLSRFCDIIKLFHSCDTPQVRQRCCSTCAKVEKRRKLF